MNSAAPTFFSIIIPTYNRAGLITETIASIQNQTFQNWECIVVDDGSTDNTKQVIEAIQQNDKRIKYVYQKNAERSAARNNGIKNSSGEYICFLDSDDHFEQNNLENLAQFIAQCENKVCMIVYQMMVVNGNTKTPTNLKPHQSNPVQYLYENALTPSRVCIHQKIFSEFLFDEDIVIIEDRILWMRIATKFPVYYSSHIGVRYNIHPDNSVNLKNKGAIKTYEGTLIGEKRYPDVFNQISRKTKADLLSRVMTNIGYHHYLHARKIEALKWFCKAIAAAPFHPQTKMRLHHIFSIITNRKIEL